MINIIYCPLCGIVTGVKAYPPADHKTGDGSTHNCLGLEIDEPEYLGETGFLTADSTEISNCEDWLTYLGKYVP